MVKQKKEEAVNIDHVYDKLLEAYAKDATPEKNEYMEVSKTLMVPEILSDMDKREPVEEDGYISYPETTNVNFSRKIYAKEEFHRNRIMPLKNVMSKKEYEDIATSKCVFQDFQLTPNQKFIANFFHPLTPYKSLLLFHGVGVGKTATAIQIAEKYIDRHDQRVLVILSSNIKDNFKREIFDIQRYNRKLHKSSLCTGTKYPDMVMQRHKLTPEALVKKIDRLIAERYQFIGYNELVAYTNKIMHYVKEHEKNPEKHQQRYEEKMRDIFSNRLIIVDEAHNLRMADESGKKQISNTFMDMLKIAENTRLVLMTATPMYNDAKEIIWIANALLTNDRRPLLKTSDVFQSGKGRTGFTRNGKKILREALNGYVSYMRGENPFSFPSRIFPSINNDKNVLTTYARKDMYGKEIAPGERMKHVEMVGSVLSEQQKKWFKEAVKRNKGEQMIDGEDDMEYAGNNDEDEEKMTQDLQNTIQLSNIIYPSVQHTNEPGAAKSVLGKSGFMNCFTRSEKRGIRYKESIKKEKGEFLSYDTIQEYSPKIKSILDYILNSEGIVFVYSQYYYSGIFPLAIALEHIGFTKYGGSNITRGITVNNKLEKPMSYIVLSKDTDISANNVKEMIKVKSEENKDGDIIKVVIVSKIATEGLDFKNIREVHLLEPWFNLNRAEQIIGRGVRQCSHISLPLEKRNVTIYMHASVNSKSAERRESVDERIYRMGERKQMQIAEVQKIMKSGAVDCYLNQGGIIYPPEVLNKKIRLYTSQKKRVNDFALGDRDGSYICDYSKCSVVCVDKTGNSSKHLPSAIDVSTFDPVFVEVEIDDYKRRIKEIFKAHSATQMALTFEQICDLVIQVMIDAGIFTEKSLDDTTLSSIHSVVSFGLQEMIDKQERFEGLFGKDIVVGELVYVHNVYLFTPSEMLKYNKRITVEEWDDAFQRLNRTSLVFEHLVDKQDMQMPNDKKGQEEREADAAKDKQLLITNIIDIVEERYLAVKETMSQIMNLKKVIKDRVYMDWVIDRLTQDELFAIIVYVNKVATSANEAQEVMNKKRRALMDLIAQSLYSAGTFIVDTSSGNEAKKTLAVIQHFKNPYDGDMYSVKKQGDTYTIKKSGPLDIAGMSDKLKDMEKVLSDQKKKPMTGLIEVKKADVTKGVGMAKPVSNKFKIVDLGGSKKGYVCTQTSSLKISDLRDRIVQMYKDAGGIIDEKLLDNGGVLEQYKKVELCDVYEILMRQTKQLVRIFV